MREAFWSEEECVVCLKRRGEEDSIAHCLMIHTNWPDCLKIKSLNPHRKS